MTKTGLGQIDWRLLIVIGLLALVLPACSDSIQSAKTEAVPATAKSEPTIGASRSTASSSQDVLTTSPSFTTLAPTLPYDENRYFEIEGHLCQNGAEPYPCVAYYGGDVPTMLAPDQYCKGLRNPLARTGYNPNEYFEVAFDLRNYLCEVDRFSFNSYECVSYFGGPAPPFYPIDLFCSGPQLALDCAEYDPAAYFEVRFNNVGYLCDVQEFTSNSDCMRYSGGPPPASPLSPDLYCSTQLRSTPRCSGLWYPDELERYEIHQIGGGNYLCERAFLAGIGDYDCYRYSGGNPAFVGGFTPDLKCTASLGSLDCDTELYPSEIAEIQKELNRWDGLSVVRIDGFPFVCTSDLNGDECFRCWLECSPDDVGFFPDYYCNRLGCSPDGWL